MVAAVIGFIALADASGMTSGSSTATRANISSKGRFRDVGSLAFVTEGLNILHVRGGSDDEINEYDDEYDNESYNDETTADNISADLVGIAISKSKKSLTFVGAIVTKLTKESINAIRRAIKAGLESHDIDEAEDMGLVPKILDVTLRMVKAAFNFDDSTDEVPENELYESEVESEEACEAVVETKADFGSVLSNAYRVDDNRGEDGPVMLGGTLTSALDIARSQARMLVIFLPVRKPSKGKKTKDSVAIESILSSEVAQAANKRASRKGRETGSFLFWAANAGSSDSIAAMKRLKGKLTSQKGEKRPVLAVVYPLLSVAGGKTKFVPKILAQHHCSPPPAESVMASWLDSLRKRHGKLYGKMQNDLKEAEYYKERKEGYSESVKSDNERKKREKEEEAERVAKEKAEQERQEALEARRVELIESLPEEDTSKDAKKVAVRFQDGQSGQRQYSPDALVSDLFNWVDAIFEMEREKVVLTSMNGKILLKWDEETNGKSLKDIGLGRNTGFRVSEAQDEEETIGEEQHAEENEQS